MRVLVNAYACAPNMGSEPGMAWNWVSHLAGHCEIDVITEGEWEEEIDRSVKALGLDDRLRFHYLPVSETIRKMCWNQGDWRFYWFYAQWQKRALEKARELVGKHAYDIIHQLNMIGFQEPGYLWKIDGIPYVWGPVGGLKKYPIAYVGLKEFKTRAKLHLKHFLIECMLNLSPKVRGAVNRADAIVSSIPESQKALSRVFAKDSVVMSETGCFESSHLESVCAGNQRSYDEDRLDLLWVGKFDDRKKLDIALTAFAESLKDGVDATLNVVGTGRKQETDFYMNLAGKLGIAEKVIWHGQVEQRQVFKLMSRCHLFFFSSVSEDTSTVVMEALSCSLPVLCFNACGFGAIIDDSVGRKVEFSNPRQSVKHLADAIVMLDRNRTLLMNMSRACSKKVREHLWENKARKMVELYQAIISKKPQN